MILRLSELPHIEHGLSLVALDRRRNHRHIGNRSWWPWKFPNDGRR